MAFPPSLRVRGRELGVLAVGLAAAVALAWAGATVHGGLRTATELAVARVAGAATDTVLAEWERMLRDSEPPVPRAGERFYWSTRAPELEPLVLREVRAEPGQLSVFETLLAEAERRELVEQDPAGALELVLEALAKEPEAPRRPEGWLRAVQLAVKLERQEVADTYWAHLSTLDLAQARDNVPYRLLGWHARPYEWRSKQRYPLTPTELGGLYLEEDRLDLGSPATPSARFELSPMLQALTQRLPRQMVGHVMERMVLALARLAPLPEVADDGRWHLVDLAGRPFAARVKSSEFHETHGFFYSADALEQSLRERAALPAGFALDFGGGDESLGSAVRPRQTLPGSALAFTLRHADPRALGRAESSRLRLLRAALFVLAAACVAGGFLMARLLARQRKLAELKSAFIAGVSHDLRTPLAALQLVAENLASGVVGEAERARYHSALAKETTRLRRLVDDVLDFARLERGEALHLAPEEVALAPFVDGLAADLGERVANAGRAFHCERSDLPEEAELDAHAVRRALLNLVDNALKHGDGRVGLECRAANGRLLLAVSDDGPGVPPGERERVFEPFERLNGRSHVGGTGLGLAIVRAVARGHGGEARVRAAEAGAGSAFELDLPLRRDAP